MTTDAQKRSLMSLILIPAVITFAIPLLRLFGELQNWSPRFFSRQAGGAGAIVGIVWLVPVFGVYFARKLLAVGEGPAGGGPPLRPGLLRPAVRAPANLPGRALEPPVNGLPSGPSPSPPVRP